MMKNKQLLKRLNKQESRFVDEYIRHGDKVMAWKAAYPNINVDERRIYTLAMQMIRAPHIKAELKQYLNDSEIKYGVSKAMLINELKNIAFFDISSIINEYGEFKSLEEIGAAKRVISEIIINKDSEGNEQRKVKVASKLTAIEMLNKMMGYNAPDEHRFVDADGNDVQPIMTVEFKRFGNHDKRLPNSSNEDDESTIVN